MVEKDKNKKLNWTLTKSKHGQIFSQMFAKHVAHKFTTDIELQIFYNVWLKYH